MLSSTFGQFPQLVSLIGKTGADLWTIARGCWPKACSEGGHWPRNLYRPLGAKVQPWPPGLPVSERQSLAVRPDERSGNGCDAGVSPQRGSQRSPLSQSLSPAAAWPICRSTCQEQNANPHRRRRTRAPAPASCVCVGSSLCHKSLTG